VRRCKRQRTSEVKSCRWHDFRESVELRYGYGRALLRRGTRRANERTPPHLRHKRRELPLSAAALHTCCALSPFYSRLRRVVGPLSRRSAAAAAVVVAAAAVVAVVAAASPQNDEKNDDAAAAVAAE